MFEVERIERLSSTLSVQVLAKVIFSFSPDIIMSPLALPKELLHPWVDEQLLALTNEGPLKDILLQLKTRPTFEEQWPDTYRAGIKKGKERILNLEKIRKDSYTMQDILSERPVILKWWNSI
jgi:hypothetical protein